MSRPRHTDAHGGTFDEIAAELRSAAGVRTGRYLSWEAINGLLDSFAAEIREANRRTDCAFKEAERYLQLHLADQDLVNRLQAKIEAMRRAENDRFQDDIDRRSR